MPKRVSDALKQHLSSRATSLCTCWRITRTDGAVYAFTDHDQNLVVGGTLYQASTGYTRSAMSSAETLQVDNLEVTGFLDAAVISERDLKVGLFDYAAVQIFMVNWADPGQGMLRLRSGWLGEVLVPPTGVFRAEIRGLTQALTVNTGEQYSPICRADLGDRRCKVPIKPAFWTPNTAVSASAVNPTFVADTSTVGDLQVLAVYQCTAGGTTGPAIPAFNPAVGSVTTESGGVAWTSTPPWRGVGVVAGVASHSRFTASGLSSAPSAADTQATVTFRGPAGYSLGIKVTIGDQSRVFHVPDTSNALDSVAYLVAAITAEHDATAFPALASASNTVDDVHAVLIGKVNPNDRGTVEKLNDAGNVVTVNNFANAYSEGDPYFAGGLVEWKSGLNVNRAMEIKSYSPATGDLQLFLGMPLPIAVGDRFYWQPGCDKTRETCRYRFNNMANFRGEPDLPGLDRMLKYPDS